MRLGDVAHIYSGLALGRRTTYLDGGYSLPALSVKDIVGDRLVADQAESLSFDHPAEADRYAARQGDVLVSARGTRLKVAVVPPELDRAVVTATLIGIRPADLVLPEVIAAFLRSPQGNKALLARARSSTQQVALAASDVATVEIPVPPMDEQHRIAELVRQADQYRAYAEDASRLRDEITQRAVLGMMIEHRQRRKKWTSEPTTKRVS